MATMKNIQKMPSELLGMETALLISTAPAKNIDVSLWFNEKSSSKGKLPQKDFDSRILSLSATMGIGQDAETKKELELAVSPLALRMVHSLCAAGEDEFKQPLIDVTYFFKICEERVNRYLEEIEAAETHAFPSTDRSTPPTKSQSDFRSWEAGEYDIDGNLIRADRQNEREETEDEESVEDFDESKEMSPEEKLQILSGNNFQKGSKLTSMESEENDDDRMQVSAEEYLRDIREKATLPRPKSAPSGGRGTQRGENADQVMQFSQDDQKIPSQSRKTTSFTPYDEEYPIHLQNNEEDEIDTVDYVKHREGKAQRFDVQVTDVPIPKKKSTVVVPGVSVSKEKRNVSALANDWHEANRAFLMASGDVKQSPKKIEAGHKPNHDRKHTSTNTAVRSRSAEPKTSKFTPTRSSAPSSNSNRLNRNASTAPRAQTPPSSRVKTRLATSNTMKNDSSKKSTKETEELWRQQLREDPLSFIFPKSSPSEEIDSPDPKRRNSFNGFMRGSLKPRSQPVFHSTNHLKPSQLTEEEINHAKDTVEDLIRQLVKKTDLYHRLQISLGYIEDYTYIPPRGQIIQSTAKEWISDRELHTSFLSARLFLNEQQIWMIKRLVQDFARFYRQSYAEKLTKLIRLKEESGAVDGEGGEERLPKSTQGPGHQLNNIWLKKYLLHLRLTKRDHSNQSNLPSGEASSSDPSAPNITGLDKSMKQFIDKSIPFQEDGAVPASTAMASEETKTSSLAKTPVPWKEWLAKKLQAEMMKGPMKPKEFTKILNGNVNTTLSKEEIELYLKNHSILPEEALLQEIEYRIEAWILDLDGRRDFQHQLNMKIRSYIWEELILKPAKAASTSSTVPIPIPKTEKHYWKLFYRLPSEEKEKIKSSIITTLINEKREMWKSSERLQKEMTKTLFWQYFQSKKDAATSATAVTASSGPGWNQWLLRHLETFQTNLQKYKQEKLSQQKQFVFQQQRKRSLASLLSLEKALKKIMTYLDHFQQMELQKKMIHLRRLAKEKGLGQGEVVTKEDFDEHIKAILLPHLSGLNDSMVQGEGRQPVEDADNLHHKSSQNLIAKVWKEQISRLFTTDSEQTLQQVLHDHQQDHEKNKISFQQWMTEKKQRDLARKKEEETKKAAKEREREIKQKNNAKAYKKWLRMRRKNQYKSMVDNKYHVLPAQRTVEHQSPWIVHDQGGERPATSAKDSIEGPETSSPRSSIAQQKLSSQGSRSSSNPRSKSAQREQRSSSSAEKRRFAVTNLNSKSNLKPSISH